VERSVAVLIAGIDVGLVANQQLDGFQMATAGGPVEWSVAYGVFDVDLGATGDEFRANLAASAVKLTPEELAWLDLRGERA